jgi:hypothetical protein
MFGFLSRSRSVTKIALTPPAARPGRHGLAVVLIVRNEAAHIAEWARFHRLAGARAFFVYDNGSTDGTVAALRAEVPDATVIPWDQTLRDLRTGAEIHGQVLAYAHAIRNFGGDYRWMAFIDTDEFLVPVQTDTLDAALAHLSEEGCLSLPWHMFGRNGHDTPPAGGVVRNYTRRARNPMSAARGVRNFKCIVDPTRVTGAGVHAFQVDGAYRSVNDRGTAADLRGRERPAFYSVAHIQLNHYYTRSTRDLAEKIGRGVFPVAKADGHARRVQTIVQNIEADEVEDLRAVDWLTRRGI